MPAITRNQRNITTKQTGVPISQPISWIKLFCDRVKNLSVECEKTAGIENRMKIALQIYKAINEDLENLIKVEGKEKWMKFVCSIFNKIVEFESDNRCGLWHKIDKNLVKTFLNELNKAKKFTINIIKNYHGLGCIDVVSKIKEKIISLESQRPRRNIPRVDYTGMDSIEPESEFDGITNIWADETIEEDPDYVFEEDEEDEEDKEGEDDKEDECPQKIKPELSAEEKSKLKQHLSQLVDSHRIRRNVARVNYAGMDMNEEDEGQLHIAKRCFEDGKVKYIWKSYSLSQANEIDDDDYVDE